MRVGINTLACVPGKSGGDGTYVRELVRHLPLAEPSTEYVLFVADWNRACFSGLPGRVRQVVCPVPPGSFLSRAVWEQVVLPRLVNRLNLDVFHAPVNVAPLGVKCPIVLTLHEAEPFMPQAQMPMPLRLYWRVFRTASAARARRILSVSAAARDEIVRYMRIPSDKIEVVYHGVDTARFRVDPGVKREGYMLWVGRAYPRKNLPRLIAAYALLGTEIHERHPLILLGTRGWVDERLRACIRTLDVARYVHHRGRASDADLPGWYQRANLVVFPSVHEAFGLPVLEALACGTPVLAADIPALHEIGGSAVRYVNPYAANEWAEQMCTLLNTTSMLESASTEGPKRAQQFSWQEAARATHQTYVRACA